MTVKVSALVSTYNSENYIRGCLENLIRQTIAENLEIIVVNSGSEENEESIIMEFMGRFPRIKYIKTKRETLYKAWNRAAKMASGKYLINANTDDRSRLDAFEIMARTLNQNREIALVYSKNFITKTPNEIFDSMSDVKKRWRATITFPYSHKYLLIWYFCGCRPMWRRDLHDEIGYFDENFKIAGDYEFCLRIAERYPLMLIPQFLCLFLSNPKGLSNEPLMWEEIRMIKKKYFNLSKHELLFLSTHNVGRS